MEARHEARKAELRDDTRRAWQFANFAGVAFVGKLKNLDHYLRKPAQDPGEMLTVLRALKAGGANMTIKRVAASG